MKLISIARYSDSFQANIAKSRLEDNGIYCTIANESLINTVWLSSELVGGLELKVYEEDSQKAIELLDLSFDIDENTEFIVDDNLNDGGISEIKCPKCSSRSVIQSVRPSMISFFLNLINFRKPEKFITVCNCVQCGNKWKI